MPWSPPFPPGQVWTIPSSFSPLSLGPTIWLKADLGTGQTVDGTNVTTWSDQSGNGNNATASATPPVYKTNIQNGLPIVRAANVGDYFTLPSLASLTAGTVFIAVTGNNSTTSSGLWGIGTAGDETLYRYGPNGYIYDDFGTNSRKQTVVQDVSGFNIYEVQSVAGAWTNWFNGNQLYTTASNTVSFSSTPWIFRANSTFHGFPGDVGEFILYSTALSTADRQSVETYLKAKWATP
jgi:hypothetical protein